MGGLMSLEEMKLDNTDNDTSNFDPFYNPNAGVTNFTNTNQIELKAQNQYMGKETGVKQQFWSPENNQAEKK